MAKRKATNNLESARLRIRQGGRILSKAVKAGKALVWISIIIHAVALLIVFIDERTAAHLSGLYQDNALYRLLNACVDLDAFPLIYHMAIGFFVALLSYAALLLFLNMISRMVDHMASGGRPFDVQSARTMRRYAFVMLALAMYNLPLGLIAFGLTLFFSYIMEYGGYIQRQADETNRIQEEIIVSFAEITENKSGQTGQHIKRVSEYSRILAEQLGMEPAAVETLRIASTMHDVGKLLIPSEILEKPGRLTDEEYAVIKRHTTYGGQLLQNVEGEEMALSRTVAMQHHERYDGKGYPGQLMGDDISLAGRIVAVADVYDALTSKRSYKDAWTEDDAYDEIVKGRGTQFDPDVVDAFVAAHDRILEVRRAFAD